MGQFDRALESVDRVEPVRSARAGEEAEETSVERMRQAVHTLVRELERYRE
jgi:hypothetical protein